MPDWNAASYDQYQPDLAEPHDPNQTGHPALGVISFALSLFTVAFFIAMIAAAALFAGPNGKPPTNSPVAIAVALGICSTPVLAMVGLGLGIGSLFQRGSKLFGILGVVFNIALLLGTILLVIIALILGSAAANRRPAGAGAQASGKAHAQECSIPPFLNVSLRSPDIEF
jgi:hypothetical protein